MNLTIKIDTPLTFNKDMAAKVRVSKSSSKRQIAFTELDKKYGKKLLLS